MPPAATVRATGQTTSPKPEAELFIFFQPQYHNGLLTPTERLNERRIRMALAAHGDSVTSIVKQSPTCLRKLLRESHERANGASVSEGIDSEIYVKHEEIELIAELICLRETYADKLVAYCQQKIHPRCEYGDTTHPLVDLNKK